MPPRPKTKLEISPLICGAFQTNGHLLSGTTKITMVSCRKVHKFYVAHFFKIDMILHQKKQARFKHNRHIAVGEHNAIFYMRCVRQGMPIIKIFRKIRIKT